MRSWYFEKRVGREEGGARHSVDGSTEKFNGCY